MFELAMTQIFIVGGIGLYIYVGPKSLPIVTRRIGHYCGRAVGIMERSKDLIKRKVEEVNTNNTSTSSFLPGIGRDFKQFQAIQSEIRSSTLNPFETLRSMYIILSIF